jgi:aldehyde dehydrogenase (NAD+)
MRAASENLTPVSLELGGKSPTIIDDSVQDMELVAQRVVWGKCVNAGQTCIAPDYIFVHENKYESFISHVKAKLTAFYGTDIKKAPDFGRIVSSQHCQRIQGRYCISSITVAIIINAETLQFNLSSYYRFDR